MSLIIRRKDFVKQLARVENHSKIWVVSTVKEIPEHIIAMAIRLADLDFINYVRISGDELSASNENYPNRPKVPLVHSNFSNATGIQVYYNTEIDYIDMYDINSPIKGNGSIMVEAILKDYPKDWSVNVFMDTSGGFWKKMEKKYNKIKWSN